MVNGYSMNTLQLFLLEGISCIKLYIFFVECSYDVNLRMSVCTYVKYIKKSVSLTVADLRVPLG